MRNGYLVAEPRGGHELALENGIPCQPLLPCQEGAESADQLADGLTGGGRMQLTDERPPAKEAHDVLLRLFAIQKPLHRWAAQKRCDERHENERHEHLVFQKAGASRNGGENDSHGSARVHAETDGRRLAPFQTAEASAQCTTDHLRDRGEHENDKAKAQVEGPHEIDPQTDRREEHGCENVRHEVFHHHARAGVDTSRTADRESGHESAENGVKTQGVRGTCSQQGDEDDQRQHASRCPSVAAIDAAEREVEDAAPQGKHRHGEQCREHGRA